jgi:hypothetical protein
MTMVDNSPCGNDCGVVGGVAGVSPAEGVAEDRA